MSCLVVIKVVVETPKTVEDGVIEALSQQFQCFKVELGGEGVTIHPS
jgi:hypothetical protein